MRKIHEEVTTGFSKLLKPVSGSFSQITPTTALPTPILGLFLKNSSGNHQCQGWCRRDGIGTKGNLAN